MQKQSIDHSMICVAVITSAHGIKGAVNVKSLTEYPEDFVSYGKLYCKHQEKEYKLKIISTKKDRIIALVEGSDNRNDAEQLKGVKLFVPESSLPEIPEDEFYYQDLVGLDVVLTSGELFGTVQDVKNYGSCDILEIKLMDNKNEHLLAFTKDLVPEINIEEGYIVADIPEIKMSGDNDNIK